MAKCGISNNELIKISRIVTKDLRQYKKTIGANIDLTVNSIIDNLTETYDINNENINDVVDILVDRAKLIFPLRLPEQFDEQNLVKKLLGMDSPSETVVAENSEDQLFQLDIITERMGSASKFWDKEYGFAGEVKAYAINQSNQFIFDSCFINRGSIGGNMGIVLNTKQLNENLRIYQQILLDKIVKYLKYIGKNDPVLDNAILYDKEGKNTGILLALRAMIDENLGKMSTDDLRVMYGIAKDNNSTSDLKELYLLKLDAYNARVLLDNFDSALLHTLGDSIIIRDFGIKTGKDKYQIADKTAKLLHTWRTKEDINAEDEINGIVKLAITTLPLLTYGSAPCTQSSVYLKYQDFQYIVAKIKDLIYKLDDNIRFDELMMSLNEREFFESLSQNTQDVLRNKSLRSVINSIRENPRKYIPAIFEVLSRSEFLDEHSELRQQFRQDELNRLYSVTMGCFVGDNSFYALSTNNADIDYFGFITQVADTVFNNKYIQYGYGPNGEIGVYSLLDQGINKVARTIEQTINTNNSRRLLNSKWGFWKSCNIDGGIDRSSDNKLAPITFDVPTSTNLTNDNQIKLHGMVYTSTGDVTFLLGDKVVTDFTDVDINLDINDVINFIDSILNIDIANNVNMRNAVIEQLGGPVNAYNHLMRFAARTLALVYTSNKLIREDEKKSKIWTILNMIDSMKHFYPENSTNNRLPRFNYTLGEPGLVDNNDVRILEGIAIAKANIDGLLTAAQVKDGSGKSLSQLTLSRLMYSYRSQFELLEKLPNSASRNFMLLKNPKLLEGIVVMKEFRDRDGKIKEFKEMTMAEMAHSSFLYDFVGGLMGKKTRNVTVGDGHVMFISSVNSDKTLMTKLCVDLNLKVLVGEEVKALKDLNSKELEYLISREFGDFYENSIVNIQSDLAVIDNIISLSQDKLNDEFDLPFNLTDVEKAPSLAADFITGYRNFNDWFYRNIGKLSRYGNNPVVFLRRITREINNRYRNNPITLIDQTHFKSVRNHEGRIVLGVNDALIANLYRYKPNSKCIAKYKKEFASKYPSSGTFWETMKRNSARLLLNENFKINTSNTQQSEKIYLRSINKDFINRSGDVVIAKVELLVKRGDKVNNEWIDVSSINDVIAAGFQSVDALFNSAVNVIFNPMLEKYLYLDFLVSQEFIDSTVGTFTNHPLKNDGNVLEQESGHFIGLNKRNVSLTAAMHQFQLNTLQGISDEYNIAVIEELNDLLGIVTGDIIEWSGMDGATFVNPFNVILENNSLGGQKAGMTKKQFIHAKDHRTGTGIIVKTAGFAMTNDWFRNSPQLKNVFKKMCHHQWIDQAGDVFDPDITHDYNGNFIKFKDIYYREFDKTEGRVKYYHILTDSEHQITKDGFGRYIAYRQEVDILGNALTEAQAFGFNGVTSNYNLWKFFGGEWSMEFDEKSQKLVPSNTSVENVVNVMNSVGIKINENVETQADLYQPLKHSDIHYLVTSGAIKQGAANINSSESFFDDTDLDFFKIKMLLAGIQLDKEHEADDSEVSAATLIISACAAMGFTIEESMNLYRALSYQTENNLNNELTSIKNLLIENTEESRIEFCNVLMNTIVKGLANSRSNSFAKTIAENVLERKSDGEKVDLSNVPIPLSDNVVYSRIIAVITSYLTNNGIKLSFKGSLSVLSPSYGLYKLYGDRKYESFLDPDTEIQALLDLADANPIVDTAKGINNSTQLRQGRTYKVTRLINGLQNEQNVTILTPQDYRNLRYDNSIVKIVENIKVGRELGSYYVTFDAVNEEGQVQSFQILDLDSTNYLTRLLQLKDNPNKEALLAQLYMEAYGEDISNSILIDGFDRWYKRTGRRLNQTLLNDLNNLNPNRLDPVEQFNRFLEYLQRDVSQDNKGIAYRRLARWFNIKFHTGNGDSIRFSKDRLETIDDNNFEEARAFIIDRLKRSKLISIGGKLHNINPKSIKTDGYEVIMPKVFRTKFGLEEFADLKEISDDPEYFVKQLIRNNHSKVDNNKYSVRFIRSNGDHVYVQHPNQGLTGLSKIDDALISYENGRYYRLNAAGEVLYQLPDDFLGIYDDGRGNDVIVSQNIKFFADSLSYDSIGLSEGLLGNISVLNDITKQLRSSKNHMATDFMEYVDNYTKAYNNSKLFVIAASNDYNNNTSNFLTAGHEKHTSFLRSLDIIASRTPGQSMLSFMSMKIVGFENADTNNCYVSTFQLLLQGSDFDIDTVTLTSFNIDDNGLLPLWSPYASLENIDMLRASEKLPMPVGYEIELMEIEDLPQGAYDSVFNRYIIQDGKRKNLFNINMDANGNVHVSVDLSTPQLIEQFAQFLEYKNPKYDYTYKPDETGAKDGLLYLIKLGYQLPYNENINPKQIMDLIYDQIKKIADRHNMYLEDMPFHKKTMIYNNYILKQEHDIILNPVNAIEALAPVDLVTKPLKKIANTSPSAIEGKRRNATAFDKYIGIRTNMVGKYDVGICAVALKSFFALTEYNDWILNHGTAEQQHRLLFKTSQDGLLIDGEKYGMLANVSVVNPSTIRDSAVEKYLSLINTDADAALVISALLSLSTDNAKDLCLDKLNASMKTIGMYLYGICKGIPIEKLCNWMMSPTGKIICQLMEGDVFNSSISYTNIKKAFKYFDGNEVPKKMLRKYMISQGVDESGETIDFMSPYEVFSDELWNLIKGPNGVIPEKYSEMTLGQVLYKDIKDNDISVFINFMDNVMRTLYPKDLPKLGHELYNQMIDDIEYYAYRLKTAQQDVIREGNNIIPVLDKLRDLAKGSDEMFHAGRMLSCNQGIKTNTDELLSLVSEFELALYNSLSEEEIRDGKIKKNDIKFDIIKMAFDGLYLSDCVEDYEKNKHSFNALAVFKTVPHYKGYLQTLATAVMFANQSYKFRTVRDWMYRVEEGFNLWDTSKIIRGINNFVNVQLFKRWMQDSGLTITLPAGFTAFDSKGHYTTLKRDTTFNLGTDWGNASFRKFMEEIVIPTLKRDPNLLDNGFIRSLCNDLYTRTALGNPTIVYTLPINMLPRNELGDQILSMYRIEFDKLKQVGINSVNFDKHYNVKGIMEDYSIPDLFILYSMTATDYTLSENSLIPLFDNMSNEGLLESFHAYQDALDKSGDILEFTGTMKNDLRTFVAPRDNPKTAIAEYINGYDPVSRKRMLMERIGDEDDETPFSLDGGDYPGAGYDPNKRGNYKIINNGIDSNYYPSGTVLKGTNTLKYQVQIMNNAVNIDVTYDVESGDITDIRTTTNGNTFSMQLNEPMKMPSCNRNGNRKINEALLEQIIQNLSECV